MDMVDMEDMAGLMEDMVATGPMEATAALTAMATEKMIKFMV